jgi:hypothetical protein
MQRLAFDLSPVPKCLLFEKPKATFGSPKSRTQKTVFRNGGTFGTRYDVAKDVQMGNTAAVLRF